MSESTRPTHFRWFIVALCLLLNLLNYLDRSIISYAIEPIKNTLHLNNTQFGLAISVFALGTLSINLLAGCFADYIKVKRLWTWAIFIWSISMILLGMAQVLIVFLILRYVLGLGEGVNFPLMNRSMSRWLPPNEQATALGIALIGVPFANLIGAPVLANLVHYIGWQNAFITLGIAGFIVGLIFIWLYQDKPDQSSFVNMQERQRIDSQQKNSCSASKFDLEGIKACFKNPALLADNVAVFAFSYILFFYISWLPGYLQKDYGMSLLNIGWVMMIPWGFASISIFLGGWLSDWLYKKTQNERLAHVHLFWSALLVSAISFIPILLWHNVYLAITCLTLAISFLMLTNSLFYAICNDVTYQYAGAATGMVITCFSFSGFISPLITGALTDITGNFTAAIVVLVVVTLAAVVGLFCFGKPRQYKMD